MAVKRKPNLQNIPIRTEEGKRIRSAFVHYQPEAMTADYEQIELRTMEHFKRTGSDARD